MHALGCSIPWQINQFLGINLVNVIRTVLTDEVYAKIDHRVLMVIYDIVLCGLARNYHELIALPMDDPGSGEPKWNNY